VPKPGRHDQDDSPAGAEDEGQPQPDASVRVSFERRIPVVNYDSDQQEYQVSWETVSPSQKDDDAEHFGRSSMRCAAPRPL